MYLRVKTEMEYIPILANLAKHIQLTKGESDHFITLLTIREIGRKELLLKEGNECTTINYLNTGVLRAYYCDSTDNENSIMFALQDWWVTDMQSFVTEKPAMLNIEALEDSIVIQLKRTDLDRLYIQVPKFERFFRIIIQNAYIREQLRIIENLSQPAEERYQNFIQKYPQVVQRVPLKQIASYLGITPEFLSVIRKNLKNK